MKRQRLDQLLADRGLCDSRQKAQKLIRAGLVKVADQIQTKPGHAYPLDSVINITEKEKFVSRGGYKLEAAFENFDLNVQDAVCADIGASTGGFTDCLLQNGASKVYAIDVGKGQLNWNLRNDSRVIVMEKINARYLSAADLPESMNTVVIDVSFISLTKILPVAKEICAGSSNIVALIKPQFEAGREQVGRGGVVRDPDIHNQVIEKVRNFGVNEIGLDWIDLCQSPIKGPAGNVEFLSFWRKTL